MKKVSAKRRHYNFSSGVKKKSPPRTPGPALGVVCAGRPWLAAEPVPARHAAHEHGLRFPGQRGVVPKLGLEGALREVLQKVADDRGGWAARLAQRAVQRYE